MYSNVFELNTDINEIDNMSDLSMPEWFGTHYANYWYTENDDENTIAIKDFINRMKVLEAPVTNNSFTLNAKVVSKYFNNKYELLQLHLERAMKELTFNIYCGKGKDAGKLDYFSDEFSNDFNNTHDYWVYLDGELLSLDEFMRKGEKTTYYIGQTLCYHCKE